MASEKDKVDELTAFWQRDKFSHQAWNNRGLNPSNPDLSDQLTRLFNKCAKEIIDAVHNHASDKQLKKILQTQLSGFVKSEYDTEEREFICDLFYELAQIIKIDFTNNISRWLYGSVISSLMKMQATLNPAKVVDTLRQTCPTCGTAIDTFIMRKEQGIPDFSWNIVQCKACKDYSLISFGPGVKEISYSNYILVEQLPKEEFTREQAEVRLEQVKHFRK